MSVMDAVRFGMILVGATMVSLGAGMAWFPAGLIVGGLFLLVPGVAGSLRPVDSAGDRKGGET